jgi:hypothetical protein
MAKKSRAITKKRRGAEQENGMAPSENVAAPAEGNSTPKVTQTMRVPRPLRPAALSFADDENKVAMAAAVISKPSQSLISARTGMQIGPAPPVRVRVVRGR